MNLKKALKVSVSGKVQGVWFRKYTEQKAYELGLKGWVKNEADGSVLMQVEGEESQLEAMKVWCFQGSPESRVDHVKADEVAVENFNSFEIRRT